MEQPGLFDVPETPRRRLPPPPGVRASRYTPRNRTLCSDCTELIHRLGIVLAPYPRPARWRVSTDDYTVYVCENHKLQRMENP